MPGKGVIATPYPRADVVAKELGVPKDRAARVIRLVDSIIVREAVSVRLGAREGRKFAAKKKAKAVARRVTRMRSRGRRVNR